MNAMPDRAALLPEGVSRAVQLAHEITETAPCALAIISTLLDNALAEARRRDGMSADDVDCLRDQVAWVIERLEGDVDTLRAAVQETRAFAELR